MAGRWKVEMSDNAKADLRAIKHDHGTTHAARIADEIETALAYEPFKKTNGKEPYGEIPRDLRHLGVPIWKLYVDVYRVSYALDPGGLVTVAALEVYYKGRDTTDVARARMLRKRDR